MGSCLGCNCLVCLDSSLFADGFGKDLKHKKVISKLFKKESSDSETENGAIFRLRNSKHPDLAVVKLKKYANKNRIESYNININHTAGQPNSSTPKARRSSKSKLKKLDVCELYSADSTSLSLSLSLSSSTPSSSTSSSSSNSNSNKNNFLQMFNNLQQEEEEAEDYNDSWNNDKLIDENFNLNFADMNQSPHLCLIGKCSPHSSSSSSTSSRTNANTNINNGGQMSYATKTMEKRLLANSQHDNNRESKYLYFVQKINQVNVDGFEWDLI